MSHFSEDHIRGAFHHANKSGLRNFMHQEPRGQDRCTSRRRRTTRRRCTGASRVWNHNRCVHQQDSFRFTHCRSHGGPLKTNRRTRRCSKSFRKRRSTRRFRRSGRTFICSPISSRNRRRSTFCTRRHRRRFTRCTRRRRFSECGRFSGRNRRCGHRNRFWF